MKKQYTSEDMVLALILGVMLCYIFLSFLGVFDTGGQLW